MRFIERYFYRPSLGQKLLAFALLPLSLLYCLIATLRRKLSSSATFDAAIVSIGNVTIGGSGKTPLTIALAKRHEARAAIILRGYKRKSKGLLVVAHGGEILCETHSSGDEASLLAQKLPLSTIIVSEDRREGILKAISLGKRIIFLDDGFRFPCNKLNLLVRPLLEPHFRFCLPSGAYRERPSLYKTSQALIVQEGREYTREVTVENPTPRMLLVTAIANPSRLDQFLPEVIGKISYQDHAFFDEANLKQLLQSHQATSLLVTEKDAVKIPAESLPLSILRLHIKVDPSLQEKVDDYIQTHTKEFS